MPISVQQFPILSAGQMSPFHQALSSGLSTYEDMARAAYTSPLLQQELLKQQYANQVAQAQAKYAMPMEQAKLALAQLQPDYLKAQTGLLGAETGAIPSEIALRQAQAAGIPSEIALRMAQAGAIPSEISLRQAQAKQALQSAAMTGTQADVLKGEMPYLINQQRLAQYKDPIISRLAQLQMAQQGGISPDLLQQSGLMPSQQNGMQGNPNISNNPGDLNQIFGNQGSNPITSPNLYSGSPAQNFALFGSPISPLMELQIQAYGKQLDAQATAQGNSFQKSKDEASDSANIAKNMGNYLDQFDKNYDKALYKGPKLGNLKSAGWLSPPGDLSAEQSVDNASQNLQVQMAQLAAKSGGGRLTNYITQLSGQLKVARTLEPAAKKQLVNQIRSLLNQEQEKPKFINAISNYTSDPNIQQQIWNQYRNQRPPVDYATSVPNSSYSGSWKEYANPEAVRAARNGEEYVPNVDKISKKEWNNLSLPEKMYVYKNKSKNRKKNG